MVDGTLNLTCSVVSGAASGRCTEKKHMGRPGRANGQVSGGVCRCRRQKRSRQKAAARSKRADCRYMYLVKDCCMCKLLQAF